jgi:arginine decarboxylase
MVAFDRALLAAGAGDLNLLRLSSILPPHMKRTETIEVLPGSLVSAAYACETSNQCGLRIAAAIAIAFPVEKGRAAVIMEQSSSDSAANVEADAVEMARAALRSRGLAIASVESIAIEHVVASYGCAFAGVIQY